MARPPLTLLAVVLGAACAACDRKSDSPPPPAPPAPHGMPSPPPGMTDGATSAGPAPLAPASVTITQIMFAYRSAKIPTQRTKEEAFALAREVIAKIRDGTPMESLLKMSDDVGPDGKPFQDGSYSFARNGPTQRAVLEASFSTAIGNVFPEPVDAGYAYLVIRRDA